MQTDYAPECLHTDVPSKEALLAAAQDGSILQATATRCDVQHNLILPLDGMTGIMPREECALGIDTGTTREIAILSRVGKPGELSGSVHTRRCGVCIAQARPAARL